MLTVQHNAGSCRTLRNEVHRNPSEFGITSTAIGRIPLGSSLSGLPLIVLQLDCIIRKEQSQACSVGLCVPLPVDPLANQLIPGTTAIDALKLMTMLCWSSSTPLQLLSQPT